jgi:enoyl-CoA hydratase/carnithine racemase
MPGETYETVEFELGDGVATITLNRVEVLNAFNQKMCDEFGHIWKHCRADDAVRVIVLQANGDRAFSTGLDRREGIEGFANPWSRAAPVFQLGPKSAHLFKPFIALIHGICAGGAFYWVCESDIVICSEDAQFFDPHVSYGMASPFVPPGLMRRIPLGEAMRMALMSLDERVSAKRAYEIGLVSEVTSKDELRSRGRAIALKIAAKSPAAVQATVRVGWDAIATHPTQTNDTNMHYSAIAKSMPNETAVDLTIAGKIPWKLR